MNSPYFKSIDRLQTILEELRAKCPWDKKQTIQTLRIQTIEELYELTDAIDKTNWENIKEELGDLLLHLMFYSKIAKEQEQFEFGDVIENVCNKLVRRHPHIYESVIVKDEAEVLKNWEQLKLQEGKKSVLAGVTKGLPAMTKAYRLQDKAKQVGFEWDTSDEVHDKILEEINELKEATIQRNQEELEAEFGDVLFSLINYARILKIDPEKALERTNTKFKKRFEYIEDQAQKQQKSLKDMSLSEMDAYWNEAKRQ